MLCRGAQSGPIGIVQRGFRRVLAVGAIEVTIHEATFWGLGAQVGCYLYVAVTKKNDNIATMMICDHACRVSCVRVATVNDGRSFDLCDRRGSGCARGRKAR